VTVDRQLNWDGCFNVRELGGFRAADGRETRWGAVVRSDSPERLTVAGWSALQAHGIRTRRKAWWPRADAACLQEDA
jgi:hypothetical protein